MQRNCIRRDTQLDHFKPNDLALANRGFSGYVLTAILFLRHVKCLCRLHQSRPTDFRKGGRLGNDDSPQTWQKPLRKPCYLPMSLWKRIGNVEVRQWGQSMVSLTPNPIPIHGGYVTVNTVAASREGALKQKKSNPQKTSALSKRHSRLTPCSAMVVWAFNQGRGPARECDHYLRGTTNLP